MKYIKFILFFLIYYSASLFSQECAPVLQINTGSEHALIYLNSQLVGKGTYENQVSEGIYHLLVVEDSLLWNSNVINDSIRLSGCDTLIVNHSLDENLYFNTDPQDVAVYNKDTLVGYTPLYLNNRLNTIELKKNDYEGKILNLSEFKRGELVRLNYLGGERKPGFFQTHIYKILLGGILVFGGSTAYFKLKADDRYDDYQRTGNDDFLQQTRKLDLISGISMGFLQINFGYLLYMILTD
jgi:hypothetical protein